jgi:hypothetical protein
MGVASSTENFPLTLPSPPSGEREKLHQLHGQGEFVVSKLAAWQKTPGHYCPSPPFAKGGLIFDHING